MAIGFEVVYSPHRPIWVPVSGTALMQVGQLVHFGTAAALTTSGVIALPAASGAANITSLLPPFGVIIGTNNATPSSKAITTSLNTPIDQITGVDTLAAQNARDWRGAEGMYAKGDPQPLVQVARITPETVLKGYFRNSATVSTTMITTLSPSAVASTAMTFATFGFTGVANCSTTYCVAGKNAGLYRVGTDASATAATYTREWPTIPATTDTFKRVNVRQGFSRMNVDTTYGMWIDNTSAHSSYYNVYVLNLDLGADSGNESCVFFFSYENFIPYNQARVAT
jgi:hypothetical protein